MKKLNLFAPFAIMLFWLYSCVPARQFEDLKAKEKKGAQELADLKLVRSHVALN